MLYLKGFTLIATPFICTDTGVADVNLEARRWRYREYLGRSVRVKVQR